MIRDLNVTLLWIEVKEKLIKECTAYLQGIKLKKNESENLRLEDFRKLINHK